MGVDQKTFRWVTSDGPAWAVDAKHVYLEGQVVPEADPVAFQDRDHDLAFFFASDSKNLFFVEYTHPTGASVVENTVRAKLVPGADVKSLVSDGYETVGSVYDQPNASIFRAHDNNQKYAVRQVRTGCGGDTAGCIVSITLTVQPK